jgi:hypothetical protein
MNYRAGEGSGDSCDTLDACDDELAQIVHRASLSSDDDVVGAGDVLRESHPGDLPDGLHNRRSFADLGLNQHVCLHAHACETSAHDQ